MTATLRCISFTVAATVMLPALLLICWCSDGEAAPAPLFGTALLGSFLGGIDTSTSTNSTSALGLLALSHLQHKIDALTALSELFALSGNASETIIVS